MVSEFDPYPGVIRIQGKMEQKMRDEAYHVMLDFIA